MRRLSFVVGALLLAGYGMLLTKQNSAQQKPKDTQEYKIPQEDIDKKNPVKATPESIEAARKIYGYDCAMCHGAKGDGKGDLVESMQLKLDDWTSPTTLAGKTDGELFYIITKGKGKMPGEGERAAETMRWNLVNLIRSFAKKDDTSKPAAETPKP
jgi:cytochrome c5